MPISKYQILLFFTAVLAFFVAVASASAATFRDIAREHPAVAAQWATDPVLPGSPVIQDAISPANSVVSADGSGYYAIAPYADLRDAQGTLIDATPALLRRGAWLRPARAGDLKNAALPRRGGDWVVVDRSLRYRLAGRRSVEPAIRRGAALYSSALPGADQLILVRADLAAIEEWVIVEQGARPFRASYDLALARGLKARQKGQQVSIVDRDGATRFEITAPMAIDEAGEEFPVAIRLATNGRSFSIRVHAKGAQGALAIDPIFRRTVNDDLPSNSYTGEVCGQLLSTSDQDYPGWDGLAETDNPWNEGYEDTDAPVNFKQCTDNNAGPLVTFSANADGDATDDFQGVQNDDGVTVRVKDGRAVAATESAFASITAPAKVGIVESNFRGHTGDFGSISAPRYRCKVEIGGPHTDRFGFVDPTIINTPWNVAANAPKANDDWKNRYLFAGYPYGSDGGGEWAIFPFEGNGIVGPGYLHPNEVLFDELRGVSQNRHMWGYFTMNLNSGIENTSFRGAPDALTLAKMPSQVRMRIDPEAGFTAGNSQNACSADGRWRVVFHDPIDPTAKPPAIDPGWHSAAEAAAANRGIDSGDNIHPWRHVDTSDSDGSGVRHIESKISNPVSADAQVTYPASDGFQLGWNPCGDALIDGQITRIRVDLAQPCETDVAGHVLRTAASPGLDPTKSIRDNIVSRSFFDGSGAHRMQWHVEDFAGRSGESEVFPAGTLRNTVPRAPRADTKGWIWIDELKPSCTLGRISVIGNMAYVRGHAEEQEFYAPPVGGTSYGVRRGSGVARVQMWQVPYDGDINSPGRILVWDTALTGELGADPLRNGVERYDIARDITLVGDVIDSGDFKMVAVAIDGVGQVSDVCEGRPDPCTDVVPGSLRLVKGATGVAAVWTTPTGRVAFDSVGRLSATVNGSPAPIVYGRNLTAFVRAAPGQVVEFTMTAACDPPGNHPTVTRDVTDRLRVDQRPSITGIGGFGLPVDRIWINAWDGLPNAGAHPARFDGNPRNDTIDFSIVDPDDEVGAPSNDDTDTDIPEYTFPPAGSNQAPTRTPVLGDRGIAIVHIADRSIDDNPSTPTADPTDDSGWLVIRPREIGGGAATAWIVDDIADINEASLNPVPNAAPTETCDIGAPAVGGNNVVIASGRWEFDCTASNATRPALAGRAVSANQLDLSLALRAIGNGARVTAFATSDEDYDVRIWLRDQRQPADNEYLTQDATPPAPDPSGVIVDHDRQPPAGAGLNAALAWIDAGNLRTDRIEPEGIVTDRDGTTAIDWIDVQTVNNQLLRVDLDVLAVDPQPGPGRNTHSRIASGIRLLQPGQAQVAGLAQLANGNGNQTVQCEAVPVTSSTPVRCRLSIEFTQVGGNFSVTVPWTVVDNAFNFQNQQATVQVRIVSPPPPCPQGKRANVRFVKGVLNDGTESTDLIDALTDRSSVPNAAGIDPSVMRFDVRPAQEKGDPRGPKGGDRISMAAECDAAGVAKWHGTLDLERTAAWNPAGINDIQLVAANRQGTPLLAGEVHETWRSNVDLDGNAVPHAWFATAPGYPAGTDSTAITRRLIQGIAVLDSGAQRLAWIETYTRAPASNSNEGGGLPGRLEARIWLGTAAVLPANINNTPPALYLRAEIRPDCQHGCHTSNYIPLPVP